MNLGSGPDLDWVNGKNCLIFVYEMLYFVNFWTLFGLGFLIC